MSKCSISKMLAVALASAMAAVAILASSAQAAFTHPYVSDITEVPTTASVRFTGPLSEPWGVTLNGGNLYFTNHGNGGQDIDEFTPAGTFLQQITYEHFDSYTWSVAVSKATGEVYMADSGPVYVYVFGSKGEYLNTWKGEDTPAKNFSGGYDFVAVDNSSNPADPDKGDVYVTDSGDKVVDVMKPSAGGGETYLTQLTGEGTPEKQFGSPFGVTVDEANGDVYVVDRNIPAVDVFRPEEGGKYAFLREVTGPPGGKFEEIGGVGVDPAEGSVYVSDQRADTVYQFAEDGSYEGEFSYTATGQLNRPEGVAAGAEGDIYVANSDDDAIDVFGPAVLVPDTTTGSASEVTRTTAAIEGVVNPDETKAKYYFEYGETNAFGSKTAIQENSGGTPITLKETLEHLKTSTTYYYRIVAENPNGPSYGVTRSFTTEPAIASINTLAPSNLLANDETFNGELNADGFKTECWFEYRGGKIEEGKTARQDAGEGLTATKISATVSNLEPNVGYSNRIACENMFGISYGPETSATTLTAPPEIITESTGDIARTRAVLRAVINPENEGTSYFFEYGLTTAYGYKSVEQELRSSSFGEQQAQGVANELESNTEYHYRVVAKNSAGIVRGPDETFVSGSPTPPAVRTGGASSITPSSATVEGVVTTEGLVTSYGFEVSSKAGEFGPPTGLGSVGAGFSEAPATLDLKGLQPKTTYYYKLVATNADGTTEGAVETFTTAGYPPDEIGVEVLPILTEPFVEWPVGGAFVNTAKTETKPAKKAVKHKQRKKPKHKGGKGKRGSKGSKK